MARSAAINPTEGCDRATTAALPWDSLHQLFGTMGYMNSGNLVSGAAGTSWVSVVGTQQESGIGGTRSPRICTGQSVS
jgi:hypothetical protein